MERGPGISFRQQLNTTVLIWIWGVTEGTQEVCLPQGFLQKTSK